MQTLILTCMYSMYVYLRESDDGLPVTYVNSPDIRASAVTRGASLRHAEVSAFEDYDITSVFFHVVITVLFGILGLCTWKLLP